MARDHARSIPDLRGRPSPDPPQVYAVPAQSAGIRVDAARCTAHGAVGDHSLPGAGATAGAVTIKCTPRRLDGALGSDRRAPICLFLIAVHQPYA